MKKAEAEKAIKREFQQWVNDKEPASHALGLDFYAYLQSERAELLGFRHSGSQYQIINAWVNSELPHLVPRE